MFYTSPNSVIIGMLAPSTLSPRVGPLVEGLLGDCMGEKPDGMNPKK